MSVYLATFVTAGLVLRPFVQWAALLSVTVATAITIRVWERGRWDVGFFIAARRAAGEFLRGILFATLLVAVCASLMMASRTIRIMAGGGFSGSELLSVFIPAALHEELAFRGYLYQKLREWSRTTAIVISSSVFALLHSGNIGVSAIALANVLMAGVLLAFAYELFRALWFPIGIHLAWNVVSGPILGFPVSGFSPRVAFLRVASGGPVLLTGGAFGIEASIFMTAVEIAGIALLWRAVERARSHP